MAYPKKRPACPRCEGHRQKTMTAGWANDQTIPVTYVACLDCDYHGHQATIWLPDEASLFSLDDERRAKNRQIHRLARGRLPQVHKFQRRSNARFTSDTLEIDMRVVPGKVGAELAKRLPALRRRRGQAA